MQLKRDMDISEICHYLEDDLKKSIVNDVKPVIKPNQKEGGYFWVTRLVLCYIDYLGTLYEGYHGIKDIKGKGYYTLRRQRSWGSRFGRTASNFYLVAHSEPQNSPH